MGCCGTTVILAFDSNQTLAIIGIIVALWVASLPAVWKISNILSDIASEIKQLRAQTKLATETALEAANVSRANALNIANIQNRFNIPQATIDG